MTPAVQALERANVSFELLEYRTGGDGLEAGLAAARALGLPAEAVFKTLIAELSDGRLATALVPVATRLDMKKLASIGEGSGTVIGVDFPTLQQIQVTVTVDVSQLQGFGKGAWVIWDVVPTILKNSASVVQPDLTGMGIFDPSPVSFNYIQIAVTINIAKDYIVSCFTNVIPTRGKITRAIIDPQSI